MEDTLVVAVRKGLCETFVLIRTIAEYDQRGNAEDGRKGGVRTLLRGGDRVVTLQRVTLRRSTGAQCHSLLMSVLSCWGATR